jgi:hypothetical protein
MCDEYRSQFISSLVLSSDDLYVEEFENFTATVGGSDHPLFRDMNTPWKLKFSIDENNKLAWSATERGTEVQSGTVHITLRDYPRDTLGFNDTDPDAHEFIETMFPKNPEIIQVFPHHNIFCIDDMYYDFDTMMCGSKYIHFDFSE